MDLGHGEATGDRDTARQSYERRAIRIILCCPSTVPEKKQGCRTWRFVSPTLKRFSAGCSGFSSHNNSECRGGGTLSPRRSSERSPFIFRCGAFARSI